MGNYPRIKELRKKANKSQKELANYLGTSSQYYHCYEIGKNEISFERAIMLAKYYNVSLDYLAGLTDIKNSELTENQREVLKLMSELSDNENVILKKLLNKLIN